MRTVYEVVKTDDVWRFVDRSNPDLSNTDIAQILGQDEKNVRRLRQNEVMLLYTADKILSCFGLNYLLDTGDIEIEVRERKPTAGSFTSEKAKALNKKRKVYGA